MLTVLIVCGRDPSPLVATFASLLPSSVAGLTADVIVVSEQPESVEPACEPVGATAVATDAIVGALERARGEWLLVLEAGARPAGEWMPAVAAHVSSRTGRAARFEVAGSGRPFWQRLVARSRRPLRAGLVMPTRDAIEALRSTTPARLPIGRAAVTLPAKLEPAATG